MKRKWTKASAIPEFWYHVEFIDEVLSALGFRCSRVGRFEFDWSKRDNPRHMIMVNLESQRLYVNFWHDKKFGCVIKILQEAMEMKRQWTKSTALAYCAKADKTETYGLKYWSARDYLKRFEPKEVQDDKESVAKT